LGTDTLDLSAFTTLRTVTLTGILGVDGFSGTTAVVTGGFAEFDHFVGSPAVNDRFYGPDLTADWQIGTVNSITASGRLATFADFENLYGGSQPDTFTVTGAGNVVTLLGGGGTDYFIFNDGASITGNVDGQGGSGNTIDYTAYTTPVRVNLSSVATLGVPAFFATGTAGVLNVQNVLGGSADDILIGNSDDNVITGNGGSDMLLGNAGNDRFVFGDNWGLNDVIVENPAGGTDTVDFSPAAVNLTFTIGSNTVTDGVNLLTYSAGNIERLIGGQGADTFVFADGVAFNGVATAIDGQGGTDTLDFSAYTTALNFALTSASLSGFVGSVAPIIGGFTNIDNLLGGSANDTLTGLAADGVWNLTGADSGAYTSTNTLTFASFQSLIGLGGADRFVFADGATISGTLDGGAGSDTLDYTAYTTSVNVNLATGTATGTGGVIRIENVIGGSANDTLTGDGNANILNGGLGDDILTGGAGDDTYLFGDAANPNSWGNDTVIELAGGGNDTVDFSATTADLDVTFGVGITVTDGVNTMTSGGNVENFVGGSGVATFHLDDASTKNVTLTGLGTLIGFQGNVNGINFDNVDYLVAGAAVNDSLTGADLVADWLFDLSGFHTYTSGGRTLTFSGFEILRGGALADTFVFPDGFTYVFPDGFTYAGSINGQGGVDTLDFSGYTTARNVTLTAAGATDGFNGTTADIVGGFSNIDNLVGSTASTDTLTGANLANTWTLDAITSVAASGRTLTFSNFESLVGGTAADTFLVAEGASFAGTIDGGAGSDTLSYAGNTSARTVTVTGLGATDGFTGTADGVNGFTNINALVGGNANDIFNGLNAPSTWAVTGGTNLNYTSGNSLSLTGFETLVGGNANDTLTFAALGAAQNLTLAALGAVDGFDITAASFTGVFQNMNTLVGGTGSDVLNVFDTPNAWNFGATNTYTNGNTLTFSAIETLNGGAGNDSFVFASDGMLTGNIEGGTGSDTIDFSAIQVARRISIAGYSDADGFIGFDASLSPTLIGLFTHINNLIGSSDPVDPDVLVGMDADATWSIGPTNTYRVGNSTLSFSSFESLLGGSGKDLFDINGLTTLDLAGGDGDDIFTLNNGAQVNVINGQGGFDTLVYFNYSGPIDYDPISGIATNVPGGLSSIEWITRAFPPPPNPPKVFQKRILPIILIVPVLSGQEIDLNCPACSAIFVRLPDGHQAGFYSNFNGLRVSLTEMLLGDLPGSLPSGTNFVAGMKLQAWHGTRKLTYLPGLVIVSFVIPEEMLAHEFRILYWDETANNGQGAWVEVVSYRTVDWLDGKLIYRQVAVVSQTGIYVLVTP